MLKLRELKDNYESPMVLDFLITFNESYISDTFSNKDLVVWMSKNKTQPETEHVTLIFNIPENRVVNINGFTKVFNKKYELSDDEIKQFITKMVIKYVDIKKLINK